MPVIRKAHPDDMKALAALDRVAWRANRKSDRIPDGEHAWRVWIDAAHVLVAESHGGHVVGGALAFPCLDERLCLHKLFVAEGARGGGLGRDLLTEVLTIARRERREIWLTVDPANHRAMNLYESLGFETREQHEHYYGDDEPRAVMACRP